MDSFLTGRKQVYRVKLPDPKEVESGLETMKSREAEESEQNTEGLEQVEPAELIEVEAPENSVNPPKVEVLVEKGIIQKIFITCDNGQYVELQCDYSELESFESIQDVEAESE